MRSSAFTPPLPKQNTRLIVEILAVIFLSEDLDDVTNAWFCIKMIERRTDLRARPCALCTLRKGATLFHTCPRHTYPRHLAAHEHPPTRPPAHPSTHPHPHMQLRLEDCTMRISIRVDQIRVDQIRVDQIR
jgi:hypothetical protein